MAEKEKELSEIVSNNNILDSVEVLEEYSRDSSFVSRVRPKCIVKPGNADQILSLVKWANETRTPLVPVSSGAPHFRGDTIPGTGGAVIVDMSEMKKVVRVDRENRVAMVEPGITFSELIAQIEQVGLRLNMPLLPRKSKSIIGSMLEREPVIMPLYQWDAQDPLSCIEVIFGTGDVFRTGGAAGPGTLEDQWRTKQAQVNPTGPGQTDFARVVQGAQGTMGIVSWATVRCEAMPTIQEPFLAGSESSEKLSEFIYRLLRLKLVDECLMLNNSNLSAIMANSHEEYGNLKNALPSWLLFFSMAGYQYFPEERLAYQKKDMEETAQQIGIEPVKAISGISAYKLLKTLEKPAEDPYWKLRHTGACQDIFFITTLDQVQKFVQVMYNIAEQYGYPTSDIGIYIQPMVQGTSCHCEFNLFYDPTSKKESDKVRELYARAGFALMNAGAFFSRPYGALTDTVYRRDGETTVALKKVKRIFDPNNIMNPGKLCF